MMWLGKTRTAYLALMISILGLFVTGIAVAETGRFNPVAEDIEAAVGNGKLTREEADTKYLEMKERLAEGGNKFEMNGAWDPISPEDIEARRQAIEAAVDSGKLTREEADIKYLEMKECLAEGGNKFEMKGAWAPVSPEDIETKVQAAKRMPLPSSR